jgi:hypothetical protein
MVAYVMLGLLAVIAFLCISGGIAATIQRDKRSGG